MNIYDFFDSRDIAEYCKSIDYKPSALESAFVIWHSRFHTIKQKHNAWQEIINTYPDEKINTGHSWLDKKGLHAFLRQYMQKQNELLARFEALEKDTQSDLCRFLPAQLRYH